MIRLQRMRKDSPVSTNPPYMDIRSEFWKELFGKSLSYETYLDSSPEEHAQKWRKMSAAIPEFEQDIIARLSGFNRHLNVLVLSGIWCGDCARQGPMLNKICCIKGTQIQLRFAERDVFPELAHELRIMGALRVPVAVFLSEDFFETGRFGDRLLTVYRKKAKQETGSACSTGIVAPPANELWDEILEWVDIFERMLLMLRLAPMLRKRYGD